MNQLVIRRPRSFGIFLGALFLLLVVMSYQVTDPLTGQSVLSTVVFRLLSPFQMMLSGLVREVKDVFRTYVDLVGTNRENARLQREVSDMRIRLSVARQEHQENERLRKILELKERVPYQLVVGEVIGRDAKSPVSETLIVNRGSKHGIKPEMPVVTPEGVVGMTILVDLYASKVQLITDSSASVGAMIENSRVAGILSGIGGGRCVLRFLPMNTVLKPGDTVITSGQDGVFPKGLPVGRVAKQISESQFYRSAEVTLFQNFSALDEIIFLSQVSSRLPVSGPDAAAAKPAPPQNK